MWVLSAPAISAGAGSQLSQPKIQHLHQPIWPEHHVLGLDVSVNDACRVRDAQSGRHLNGEIKRFADRQPRRRESLSERLALDVLHRDVVLAVAGLAECVDGADIGVVEGGRGSRLLLEPLDTERVPCEVCRQDLQCDLPAQAHLGGEPHLAHPARAEGAHDLVGVQAGARADGHVGVRGIIAPRAFDTARLAVVLLG
jgi:hypothetical protein